MRNKTMQYLVPTMAVMALGFTACTAAQPPVAQEPTAESAKDYSPPAETYKPPKPKVPKYVPSYNCRNVQDDVVEMALAQHTSGVLLVGIGKFKKVEDNQPTNRKNGWVLKCEGLGIASGGNDTWIWYGIQTRGGDTYVSMEPK